jgi:hypothetical protein
MPERRRNHLTRRFVAEMSQKAKSHAGLVSDNTGLPNRQAFDSGKASPFAAMTDVRGMKVFNEQFSHAAGDMLIRRFAEVLTSVGLDAYHSLGATILCKGESYEELNLKLSQAQQILRQQSFSVRETNGRIHTIEGADFCFGIGTTLEEAEVALNHQKQLQTPEKAKRAGQKS